MNLTEYKKKRHFKKTSEPKPGKNDRSKKIFVFQKHDASNLHYDFRISVDGVLKSWAVPKGPSTDPSQKRLAIQTEDHPIEYANFEGVIPEGEYGAGTVMVWDKGEYKNLDEENPVSKGLKKGHIKIWLSGEKLEGGYSLVNTNKDKWLLVKINDEKADARRNPVSTEPKSVKTGRTLKKIAEDEKDE